MFWVHVLGVPNGQVAMMLQRMGIIAGGLRGVELCCMLLTSIFSFAVVLYYMVVQVARWRRCPRGGADPHQDGPWFSNFSIFMLWCFYTVVCV